MDDFHMTKRLLLTLRSLFCSHAITLRGLQREGDGSVSARCVKCGKVLHGTCGLQLPAKFVPKNQASIR